MKLTCVMLAVIFSVLWACGVISHAHLQTPAAHLHPPEGPVHAHTLGKWAGSRWNFSCGDLEESLLFARLTLNYIDEFKDRYARTVFFNLSWEEVDRWLNSSEDSTAIQVCGVGGAEEEGGDTCLYVLPPLPPPPHLPPPTQDQAKRTMQAVLGYLHRYVVAMEVLVLDQALSKDDPKALFLEEMNEVLAYLEGLLEEFLIPVTSCQLTPDLGLSRNLTSRMFVDVGKVTRDIRGFCGLRQTRLGLQYFLDVFSTTSSRPDTP